MWNVQEHHVGLGGLFLQTEHYPLDYGFSFSLELGIFLVLGHQIQLLQSCTLRHTYTNECKGKCMEYREKKWYTTLQNKIEKKIQGECKNINVTLM